MKNILHIQILTALAVKDAHGYGVLEQLSKDGVVEAMSDPRHVYRLLKRMTDAGYIEQTQDGRTKTYHLTKSGRQQLLRARSQMDEVCRRLFRRL